MKTNYPKRNRLWKYRKEKGLTQKEVAKFLKLKSPTQICKWEKGKTFPSVVQLMRLSAIYCRLANDLLWDLFIQEREEISKRERKLCTEN